MSWSRLEGPQSSAGCLHQQGACVSRELASAGSKHGLHQAFRTAPVLGHRSRESSKGLRVNSTAGVSSACADRLSSEGSEALAQLPREAVGAHPCRHSRPGWTGPCSNLTCWVAALPWQALGLGWVFLILSYPSLHTSKLLPFYSSQRQSGIGRALGHFKPAYKVSQTNF